MSARRAEPRDDYFARSREPLAILVFLAPLIAAYEIGAALFLAGPAAGVAEDIRAHHLLARFFEAFGVGGFYLPGIVLVVVLLVWHVIAGKPWRLRSSTLLGMLLESAVWTVPLLVLAQLVASSAQPAAVALSGPASLDQLPLAARATIAIGAGLYEELLFRLVAIALVHLLLADALGVPARLADTLSVLAAAVAFALYHEDPSNFLFYLTAGLFFGGLFIARGLGIVVAAHAIYDLVVLLL